MTARRVTAVAGDVGRDGLGLDDAGPGRPRLAATSSSTRPPPCRFDSPLDSAVEVNLLGPTRIAETAATSSASPPTSSPCPPATSPATAAARPPRSSSTRARSSSTSTGAREVDGARRARRDAEAESRTPEMLAELPRPGPHASSAPPAARCCREDRAAPRPLGRRPHGRRRPGPRRLARLARRLRLHQGPRRAGAASRPAATCRSASCARRSSSRRWPSPAPAGSAASAWPSRSSSPTPAAC